jgi:hypothetical protein
VSIVTFAFMLLFFAAQGFAVLLTAALALKLLRVEHWSAKIAAMFVSYLAWITFTLSGYAMLGGEGGLMDGFGMMLFLCFTALLSAAFWTAAWLVTPLIGGARHG